MVITDSVALFGIRQYQQHISPRKGWRCAFSHTNGGPGCSGAVSILIEQHGLIAAIPFIQERFKMCRMESEKLKRRVEVASDLGESACECGLDSCPDIGGDCGSCDVGSCDLS